MVRKTIYKGKPAYLCGACGLGYLERGDAEACERFCTEHGACSTELTKKAVMRG